MEGERRSGGFGGGRRGGFGNRGGGFGGRRGGFGGNRRFNDGPREMHDAKCSDCGKDCQVPFKPTEGKPVYCRECYFKRKDAGNTGSPQAAPKQEAETEEGF